MTRKALVAQVRAAVIRASGSPCSDKMADAAIRVVVKEAVGKIGRICDRDGESADFHTAAFMCEAVVLSLSPDAKEQG